MGFLRQFLTLRRYFYFQNQNFSVYLTFLEVRFFLPKYIPIASTQCKCLLPFTISKLQIAGVTFCTTSLTFKTTTFCPHCIYVFYTDLKTNGDHFPIIIKLMGFLNNNEYFDILLTVHLNIFILILTNLMH